MINMNRTIEALHYLWSLDKGVGAESDDLSHRQLRIRSHGKVFCEVYFVIKQCL